MGNFLEKPKTEKICHEGKKEELSFFMASMQGWRLEMEDAHTHELALPTPYEKWSFFAVFDGHAGSTVAEQSAKRLVGEILGQEYLKETLVNDASLVRQNLYDVDKVSDAIKQGFLSLDAQLKKEEVSSGSTATALLITPKHYLFINAGDSRSLLVRKDDSATGPNYKYDLHSTYKQAISDGHFGETTKIASRNSANVYLNSKEKEAENNTEKEAGDASSSGGKDVDLADKYYCYYSTIDHKPFDDEEKRRIEAAGGMVIIQRINGALAVSRALGDFDYKRNPDKAAQDQQVSPYPVVEVLTRSSSDSYAVLACDGIYDAITNENLIKYITYKMLCGESIDQITKGCLDLCLNLGSRDNMSLIVVKLSAAPTVDENVSNKEEEINRRILDFMDNQIQNETQYEQVLSFNTPQDKLFFDFYTEGHLKRLCGEDYIYSTALSTPPASNSYAVNNSYSGGLVDKHRLIRKHVEHLLESKKAKAKGTE